MDDRIGPDRRREPSLSDAELRAIRIIIKADDRTRWLWSNVRIWVSYGVPTVAALYAGWDQILKVVKRVFAP
jgi:hypothetical protein